MDRDVIKQLIEALAASDLVELEYRSNDETLRLVKRAAVAAAPPHTVPAQHGGVSPVPASPSPPRSEPEAVVSNAIVAPIYGIVHLQETRGAPPLVALGQSVTAGQVLCLIEAMKVFSEVRAERDGKITAVLVQSGQEVEAGQSLFQLD